MNKIIWLICILLVGGYFANSYRENNAKHEAERAKNENIDKKIKASVQKIISRTNAVNDWRSKLSNGKSYRIDPILTLELEKSWITKRPIIFFGSIHDIKTLDEYNYTIVIERNYRSSSGHMYRTDLMLSLVAPKKKIDIFLKNHPNLLKGLGFNNGVAVIAKINSIKTTYISEEDIGRKEVKIGEGSMIELEYIGNLRI